MGCHAADGFFSLIGVLSWVFAFIPAYLVFRLLHSPRRKGEDYSYRGEDPAYTLRNIPAGIGFSVAYALSLWGIASFLMGILC